MSLQMWKTVMWFFFFSMIKRMLLLSKSMLSSNLCETWDLILNESIMKLLVIDRVQQLRYRISAYQVIFSKFFEIPRLCCIFENKNMINIDFTCVNNVSNKSLDNLFGGLVSSINSSSVYYYTDINVSLMVSLLIPQKKTKKYVFGLQNSRLLLASI